MSNASLYCNHCEKYVAMNGKVGDYRCPTCHSPVKIGDGPGRTVQREASRNSELREVELREQRGGEFNIDDIAKEQLKLEETFKALGLSETEARIAAQGRAGLGESVMGIAEKRRAVLEVLNDKTLDEASLEDHFRSLGLSESAAKIAAKGRK